MWWLIPFLFRIRQDGLNVNLQGKVKMGVPWIHCHRDCCSPHLNNIDACQEQKDGVTICRNMQITAAVSLYTTPTFKRSSDIL